MSEKKLASGEAEPLQLVKRFAAGFAHELRTPLTVIRNAVYYLKHTIPLSEETTESLDMIEAEAQAINRVLTRLVEVTHEFELKCESADLQELATEAIDIVDHERSIEWQFDLSPQPFNIWCDKERLRHVLYNVFKNAAYCMKGIGRVTIRARHEGDRDLVEIRDSGSGVADEVRDTLFDPFITTKSAGIGLGLTYCRQIVGRHGGLIELTESSSKGAAFQIKLPN